MTDNAQGPYVNMPAVVSGGVAVSDIIAHYKNEAQRLYTQSRRTSHPGIAKELYAQHAYAEAQAAYWYRTYEAGIMDGVCGPKSEDI